jgi:phosphoglycolate phosphatase
MKKKKLLIFDLDGTLINSKKDIITSFNYVFKKNNFKTVNNFFFLKHAGLGSKYLIKKNCVHISELLLNKINNDFKKFYFKQCIKNTLPKNGLFTFLKETKDRFYNVISTNKSESVTKKILKKLKIYKFFDAIYGYDTLKYNKPDKRHLKKILSDFSSNNRNSFFFGDSYIDYQMSKKVNVKFILLTNGYCSKINRIKPDFKIGNYFKALKLVNNL